MPDRRAALGMMAAGLAADPPKPDSLAVARLDALRAMIAVGRKLLDAGDWSALLLFNYFAAQREAAAAAAAVYGDTAERVAFHREWAADTAAVAAAAGRLVRTGAVARVCLTLAEAQDRLARAELAAAEGRGRK